MTVRRTHIARAAVAAAALAAVALPATMLGADSPGEESQSWISGVGDDANPCTRTAPCKTIAGALDKTDAGGTINAYDPGGYGSATITKAITIDLSSASGSVAYSGLNGLQVAANADDAVVIRGIDFTAAGCSSTPGVDAIRVVTAGSVTIENSTFTNFTDAAVRVSNTATSAPVVTASGLRIRNGCPNGGSNSSAGVLSSPTGGGTNQVQVSQSVISGVATGVRATSGGAITLLGSTIWGNVLGVDPQGTGTINADHATRILGNTVNGTLSSWVDGPPTGPTGNTGQAGLVGQGGPTGAPGAEGAQGPDGVGAVLVRRARAHAPVGRGITIAYVANQDSAGILVIRRGGRVVARMRTHIRAGAHGVRWNGRLANGIAAPAGRYVATVSLADTASRTASDSTAFRVGR